MCAELSVRWEEGLLTTLEAQQAPVDVRGVVCGGGRQWILPGNSILGVQTDLLQELQGQKKDSSSRKKRVSPYAHFLVFVSSFL
jgi:hypothetical protein